MPDSVNGRVAVENGRAVCASCERPYLQIAQGSSRPKRHKITIYDDDHVLEDLLEQLVQRFQTEWPDLLFETSKSGWRRRALEFGCYALLTAPPDVAARLFPRETGP